MPQAVGDPEELERFAQSIGQFIENLNESVNSLDNSFQNLGDTWQDAKRARFEEDYNELIKNLKVFEENALEQIPYLQKLAARLRDYLES